MVAGLAYQFLDYPVLLVLAFPTTPFPRHFIKVNWEFMDVKVAATKDIRPEKHCRTETISSDRMAPRFVHHTSKCIIEIILAITLCPFITVLHQ